MPLLRRGLLISVEGTNTSYQSNALATALQSVKIDNLDWIDDREFCAQELHLITTSCRWKDQQQIKQSIFTGTDVFCDEYCDSDIERCIEFTGEQWSRKIQSGLICPDLVIVINNETLTRLCNSERCIFVSTTGLTQEQVTEIILELITEYLNKHPDIRFNFPTYY